MKIKKFLQLGSALVISTSSLLFLGVSSVSAATTYTWTGGGSSSPPSASCHGSGVNCAWSEANNWQGGVAPSTSDGTTDNLVFPDSNLLSSATETTIDDISGLTVNSITFSGANTNGGKFQLTGGNGITLGLGGGITDTSTSTNQSNIVDLPLNLTADQTFASAGGLVIGGPATGTAPAGSGGQQVELSLNGHTLTLSNTSSSVRLDLNLVQLNGSGVIATDANLPNATYNIGNFNLGFSGDVDVNAGLLNIPDNLSTYGVQNSSLNVASGASLSLFAYGSSKTSYANPITIGGGGATGINANDKALIVASDCSSGGCGNDVPITFSGAVNLTSDTDAYTAANLTFTNLACTNFTLTNALSGTITGGPAQCPVAGSGNSKAPGTPDTGLAALVNNPWVAGGFSLLAAVTLVYAARRVKPLHN